MYGVVSVIRRTWVGLNDHLLNSLRLTWAMCLYFYWIIIC